MIKLKALFAAVALAFAPLAASAVTVLDPLPASASFGEDFGLVTSETATFQINDPNGANLAFVFSGTSASKAALEAVTYNIFGTDYTFSSIVSTAGLFIGAGSVTGLTFGPGLFDVVWGTPAGVAEAGFTVIATPIPLPAAGWMLISALGGMGLLARARSRQEA